MRLVQFQLDTNCNGSEIFFVDIAINAARTDLKDLCNMAASHPDQRVRDTADKQAQTVSSQLNIMYTDIQWMMRNYRIKYPKPTKQ